MIAAPACGPPEMLHAAPPVQLPATDQSSLRAPVHVHVGGVTAPAGGAGNAATAPAPLSPSVQTQTMASRAKRRRPMGTVVAPASITGTQVPRPLLRSSRPAGLCIHHSKAL